MALRCTNASAPQLPLHGRLPTWKGLGLSRPRHLQRHQLPHDDSHGEYVLQQLGRSRQGLQVGPWSGVHPPCCRHAPSLLNQALPQLRSLCCTSAFTESKVARSPCSTSGLSQRGLVAPMLVSESASDPSITCGMVRTNDGKHTFICTM